MPTPSVHLKIKMAATNGKTPYISTISWKNRTVNSLATKENLKFQVACPSARNGVLVTIYSDHVECVCGRYRHDNICKRSIAVVPCEQRPFDFPVRCERGVSAQKSGAP